MIVARRVCLSLMVAHAVSLVATAVLTTTLQSSTGLWWLARAAGFSVIWIAIGSAVIGVTFLLIGILRKAPSAWHWGGSLLLINVLPYVIVLAVAQISGLPES